MLLRRCAASICSKRRQRGEVLLISRFAHSPANRDLNFEELEQQAKSSVNAEALFGIAPRKVRDGDDDDFTPSSVPTAAPSTASPPARHNYFSETWEMQKRIIMGDSTLEEEKPEPSQSPQFIIIPPSPAPERIWQVAPDVNASFDETFKFVSLKVLSTEIAIKHRFDLYSHLPSNVVDWKIRRKKVLKDLQTISADIICLQEVDNFNDLHCDLSLEGYNGRYQGSTGSSNSGCAIFWKQNRFKLLHEENMDFFALRMRFKVAQLCVFQMNVSGTANDNASSNAGIPDQHLLDKCVLVGNMEALFNPRRGDIKLAQCRLFFERVHELSLKWPGVPLVIGGCFHATPQSYIYKFISESELDLCGLDYRNLSGHFMVDEQSVGMPPVRDQPHMDEYQRSENPSIRITLKDGKHSVNASAITSNEDSKSMDIKRDRELLSKAVKILSKICQPEEPSKVVDENVDSLDKSAGTGNSPESEKHPSPGENAPKPVHHEAVHPVNDTSSLPNVAGLSNTHSIPNHGWDANVLKEVCGSDNCTIVRHNLRLFSVYPEVQAKIATRDAKGEPCITMMHNEFKGTVDYVWRSEGLKTLKVLDTFSMDEFMTFPMIPFTASGSDHVSLACELAFCPRQE